MTSIYPSAFYLGVLEELEKQSEAFPDNMPINENILPTITNQARWKYVRTKDGLKLTDGNMVYSFKGLPEDYPSEDARVERAGDDNILNLEQDALGKGTAQIHRSSPDNIYMTLADGRLNPTFMLQHEGGSNWRYSPSKKFMQKLKAMQQQTGIPEGAAETPVAVDPSSLIAGAQDTVKQAYYNPVTRSGGMDASELSDWTMNKINTAKNFMDTTSSWMMDHPILSLLGGYGVARGIGAIRDKLNPERVAERERDPLGEAKRQTGAIAAAALPLLARGVIYAK